MNNKISILLAAGVLALSAASCSENWTPDLVGQTGTLSLKSMGVTVNTSSTVVSRAEGDAIDLRPFLVTIVPMGDGAEQTFAYGDMPEVLTLPTGRYRVDVESHKIAKAEWAKPYYKGSSAEFEINNNEVTEIGNVVCRFASLQVSVAYTDELRALMANDVKVTVSANDEGSLEFTPSETRSGYFEVVDNSTTLAATFEGTVDGVYTTNTVTYSNVQAGIHYIVTFKVKRGPDIPTQTGGVEPGAITVEGVVSEEEVGSSVDPGNEDLLDGSDRPGQEQPDDPGEDPGTGEDPQPGDEAAITFSSTTLDLEGINNAQGWSGDAIVTITAEKGFAHIYVTIDSEALTADMLQGVGLTTQFDLAYPEHSVNSAGATVDLTDGLTGLGFPIKGDVIDQTEVNFDITQFVPLLGLYPGASNFIIKAVDNDGNSKTMTLKFIS